MTAPGDEPARRRVHGPRLAPLEEGGGGIGPVPGVDHGHHLAAAVVVEVGEPGHQVAPGQVGAGAGIGAVHRPGPHDQAVADLYALPVGGEAHLVGAGGHVGGQGEGLIEAAGRRREPQDPFPGGTQLESTRRRTIGAPGDQVAPPGPLEGSHQGPAQDLRPRRRQAHRHPPGVLPRPLPHRGPKGIGPRGQVGRRPAHGRVAGALPDAGVHGVPPVGALAGPPFQAQLQARGAGHLQLHRGGGMADRPRRRRGPESDGQGRLGAGRGDLQQAVAGGRVPPGLRARVAGGPGEDAEDLQRRVPGVAGQDQGGGPRHVGSGHGGARQGAVPAPRTGAVNRHPGGGQVDARAEVGERRGGAVAAGGGDGDRARQPRRVEHLGGGLVAGGGHHHHPPPEGEADGVVDQRRVGRISEAQVEHVGPAAHRVDDGRGDVVVLQVPGLADDQARPQRHHPDTGGHAGDALAVAGGGGGDPGHVGPVPGVVGRVGVALEVVAGARQPRGVGEVPAGHVVDVAVAVVVEARLPQGLGGVAPDPVPQVRVAGVDPRVDDGDQHPLGRARIAGAPADRLEPPLLVEEGVVGAEVGGPAQVVGLRRVDGGDPAVTLGEVGGGKAAVEAQYRPSGEGGLLRRRGGPAARGGRQGQQRRPRTQAEGLVQGVELRRRPRAREAAPRRRASGPAPRRG